MFWTDMLQLKLAVWWSGEDKHGAYVDVIAGLNAEE